MFGRKSKTDGSADLAGQWTVDLSDAATVDASGNVTLQFDPGGTLTYTIWLSDKKQIMLRTYRIEGNTIITDQPSHPNEERSAFEIDGDKLTIMFGSQRSKFVRA